MNSFTVKYHNSFRDKNNTKAIHSFAPRSLIFKLKHIDMSWSSPKTDLETNFLNLGLG